MTTKPKSLGKCSALVPDYTGWHDYRCLNNAKVIENGKPWCTVHTPSRIEAKRKAKSAVWEAKWDKHRADALLLAAAPELLALCEQAIRLFGGHTGSPEDPKTSIEVKQGFNVLERMKDAIAKAKGEAEKPENP